MRIAYLINCYPAPSHSFVRREIAGVEAAGLTVLRYSIRPAPGALPDPRDAAERGVTTTVLAQGALPLIAAVLIEVLAHPLGFLRALGRAFTMARVDWSRGWRQLAYLCEAAWLNRDWRRQGVTHVHAPSDSNSRRRPGVTMPPSHGPQLIDTTRLPGRRRASTWAVLFSTSLAHA